MRKKLSTLLLVTALVLLTGVQGSASPPARWVEARSTHFVVLTDSSEKDARRIATQFERMRVVFHTLLPAADDDSAPPIMVLVVKDRKGMQAVEPEAYLAKHQLDLAGFFMRAPDKSYILVRLDAEQEHAYSTVYHEYTHYMLRKADNWLPLWLNEGLAEFYENTDIDEKTAWLGEASPDELNYLKRNEMLPVEMLLRVDTRSPFYHEDEKGSMFYAESWALTHYLIVGDRMQGTHRVRDYSTLLASGEDSVTAARHAFGDLGKLQDGLNEYVMQRKFMYFMMPVELAEKDAEIKIRPVTEADADAVRADLMVHTNRTGEAKTLLETVLSADPNNALAHEAMGLTRYRDGNIADAKKWFEEAVALDASSSLAHFYYAMAMLRGGTKSQDDEIESNLLTAMQLNPELAPAYDALAMFYATRHRMMDEAHRLTMKAVELDPSQLSFRLNCAEVLAEERHFADALGMLQAAMRLAKTPGDIRAVQTRVARVERSQMAMENTTGAARSEGIVGQ